VTARRLSPDSAALALALLAWAIACGGAQGAIRTSSAPQLPAWTMRPPQESGAVYFIGAKAGADSLEEGMASATDGARAQAAQYIGVEISAEHSDLSSTELAQDQVQDKVKSRSAALIRGAQVADVYHERISRRAGATTIDRYDVWVLIRLPEAELALERQRQAQDAASAAQAAVAGLRAAREQEQAGDWLSALSRYREVVVATKPLQSGVATGDKQLPSAGLLLKAAENAAAHAQLQARRAILLASEEISVALVQALSAKGFRAQVRPGFDEQAAQAAARSEGIPWVIIARAQTTPGGPVFALVAASASLDVRALDARSGAVVAASQKMARGNGRTPEAAARNAAAQAGLDAGDDLAAALVAKESSTGL
jgi:hypothetical protein